MPTLPWTKVAPAAAGAPMVVMASRFRVRGYRHVLPFLLDALRIRAQVRRADGALGVSLVARPLRREFATLSAWHDRAAIDAMVQTQPHLAVMRRYRTAMEDSRFVFWDSTADNLPISWDEAWRQLQ